MVHILMEHGVTQAKGEESSKSAGKSIKNLDHSIKMNREAIKEAEAELLGHVQRMAELEEVELRRMATDISQAEEKAATHGKGLNFFATPKLHADMRKKYGKRQADSFQADEDARLEV